MNIKTIIIAVIIIALAFAGFVVYKKFTLPTESQTAERMYNFNPTYNLTPGFGGCLRVTIPSSPAPPMRSAK